MLPTPDTSHVPYSRVYEPAEDSFLMIDTLALPTETAFLQERFGAIAASISEPSSESSQPAPPSPPLVVEIGSGSGVVLAFVAAQSAHLFGPRSSVLAMAVDVNSFACQATTETVKRAQAEAKAEATTDGRPMSTAESPFQAQYLGAARADLVSSLRPGQVDILLFNPPYVPTPDLPGLPPGESPAGPAAKSSDTFARDSHLLELAYAGGRDGMETTDRLLDALPSALAPRGCAYILLCAQNRPDTVKERIRSWPHTVDKDTGREHQWRAETVGTSGKQAGWEKLQIVRIWRE